MDIDKIIERIERAISLVDPEVMDEELNPLYSLNQKELKHFVHVLIKALRCETHYRHEDIVSLFQKAKDPRANQVLFETTFKKFEHLSYDDTFGLARKCTWALADIGTNESKELLEKISLNSNEMIAGYAKKRLTNWEQEKNRKTAANNGYM